jgi:hypothetical protein
VLFRGVGSPILLDQKRLGCSKRCGSDRHDPPLSGLNLRRVF